MNKGKITLKITRKKEKKKYSITIRGHGSVTYKIGKNVKMVDISDIPLEEKDLIDLLEKVINLDFSSKRVLTKVEEGNNKGYTSLSLEIEDKKYHFKEKNIKHYNDDPNVPQEIIDLENSIEKLTKASEWLKNINKVQKEKGISSSKNLEKKSSGLVESKKINRKFLNSRKTVMIVVIFLSILIIFFGFTYGFFGNNKITKNNESNNCNNSLVDENSSLKNSTPIINIIVNETVVNAGSAVFFSYTYENFSNPVSSQEWDFGFNITSNKRDPVNSFIYPGNYTVRLKVVDTEGINATDYVVINVI